MLAGQFLKINRKRNLIAVCAIVLTSMLFTSLFTGTVSMILTKRQADMKRYCSYSHAAVQSAAAEQAAQIEETLKQADFVKSFGHDIFLGTVADERLSFLIEVRSGDEKGVEGFNCLPTEGQLPEKKEEIALSTVILDTLGIPRTIGAEVTLSLALAPETQMEYTFTLSGYWDADKAQNSQFAWVSETFAEEYAYPATEQSVQDGQPEGSWTYNVWYHNLWNLEKKTQELEERSGMTGKGRSRDGFEVNPAFLLTAEGSNVLGSATAMVFLICLAGYLIIYNIFSISVKNDIRAYGLLKNVGTTGKQLKTIVRLQAFMLCVAGIPVGLICGYLGGLALSPTLTAALDAERQQTVVNSANPMIFVVSACFALLTVYLSSIQACRIVAKVSPVEALRLSESCRSRQKSRTNQIVSWWAMALQNLWQNRSKGLIVMISVALSLFILNCIAIMTRGYDFKQYSEIFLVSDFSLDKLTSSRDYTNFNGITPQIRKRLEQSHGLESAAYVYFHRSELAMSARLEETWTEIMETYGSEWGTYWQELWKKNQESGTITLLLLGINQSAFEKLEWSSAPCTWEEFASGEYVLTDYPRRAFGEYYNYQSGDRVQITYETDGGQGERHAKEYGVLGEAALPLIIAYPYTELISVTLLIPEEEFIAQTGNDNAMRALLDAEKGREKELDAYLKEEFLLKDSMLHLKSILDIREGFERFVNKYYIIGGALALIIGLIGIMNFFNTIAASILSRRKEFALLETVGMTKQQLRKMLTLEGIIYLAGALLLSIALTCIGAEKILVRTLGIAFFFQAKVTILPGLLMTPGLLLIAWVIPRQQFAKMSRESLVERIRQE